MGKKLDTESLGARRADSKGQGHTSFSRLTFPWAQTITCPLALFLYSFLSLLLVGQRQARGLQAEVPWSAGEALLQQRAGRHCPPPAEAWAQGDRATEALAAGRRLPTGAAAQKGALSQRGGIPGEMTFLQPRGVGTTPTCYIMQAAQLASLGHHYPGRYGHWRAKPRSPRLCPQAGTQG